MENKQNKKKILVAAVALVVLLAAAAILYTLFAPKPEQGSKGFTVTVVDDEGQSTEYKSKTDAEFLRQALEELEGLEIEGSESEYGLYIEKVNGLSADYATDGAYWAIYVNGEYGMYSVDEQPVTDGDEFAIKYELAQ